MGNWKGNDRKTSYKFIENKTRQTACSLSLAFPFHISRFNSHIFRRIKCGISEYSSSTNPYESYRNSEWMSQYSCKHYTISKWWRRCEIPRMNCNVFANYSELVVSLRFMWCCSMLCFIRCSDIGRWWCGCLYDGARACFRSMHSIIYTCRWIILMAMSMSM